VDVIAKCRRQKQRMLGVCQNGGGCTIYQVAEAEKRLKFRPFEKRGKKKREGCGRGPVILRRKKKKKRVVSLQKR